MDCSFLFVFLCVNKALNVFTSAIAISILFHVLFGNGKFVNAFYCILYFEAPGLECFETIYTFFFTLS
uniref:Uncharacterized protein n=1 Tax=Amblyomma cajennense TaxID=34607 RepID=A0A023FB61_AMBCJ